MNRSQRILKLVSETGSHLPQVRKIVFELHALAKLDDFSDVGHQTERAFDVLSGVANRRDAQADTTRPPAGKQKSDFLSAKCCGGLETLFDHRRHPGRRTEE